MRTMVNAVGKSDLNNKVQYLRDILKKENIHKRLELVSMQDLDFTNRLLQSLMLKNMPRILLLIGAIYRKVK